MAKKTYIGVNNVAREVKKMYIGVNGIAKKVTKAYIGDENGKARLVYQYQESSGYQIYFNDIRWDAEGWKGGSTIRTVITKPDSTTENILEGPSNIATFEPGITDVEIKVYRNISHNYPVITIENYDTGEVIYSERDGIYNLEVEGGSIGSNDVTHYWDFRIPDDFTFNLNIWIDC